VLAATTTLVVALLMIGGIMPGLPHQPPLPEPRVSARWRVPLLDHFDATARPHGVVYDPLRLAPAAQLVPLASVEVAPGLRSAPQPLRVLHNGRFSLPTGRYRADVEWTTAVQPEEKIGLQVGRIEPEWQAWKVTPAPGQHWTTEFDLPVDSNFVAFRGSPELERAIGRITITPVSVTNESRRPHLPMVLSTRQYRDATLFFHDERVRPESAGFWVLGGQRATITVSRDSDATPLVLHLHSGPKPNRVIFRMRGWEQIVDLKEGQPESITLPDSNRRVLTLDIAAEDGFRPVQYDARSRDTRFLGAWVELASMDVEP
jgi:hypothetical protein